jgi:hypothetical protein
MIPELEAAGYLQDTADEDHITGGYRTPAEAHRFSTAYHIIHDLVPVESLENDPTDSDGNIWYREEWEYLFPQCSPLSIALAGLLEYRIKHNASTLASATHNGSFVFAGVWFVADVSYALEGYPRDDVDRLPNSGEPQVSRHVTRQAVDIGNYWAVPLGRRWEQTIDDIARRYNLVRPYNNLLIEYAGVRINEPWHYERP